MTFLSKNIKFYPFSQKNVYIRFFSFSHIFFHLRCVMDSPSPSPQQPPDVLPPQLQQPQQKQTLLLPPPQHRKHKKLPPRRSRHRSRSGSGGGSDSTTSARDDGSANEDGEVTASLLGQPRGQPASPLVPGQTMMTNSEHTENFAVEDEDSDDYDDYETEEEEKETSTDEKDERKKKSDSKTLRWKLHLRFDNDHDISDVVIPVNGSASDSVSKESDSDSNAQARYQLAPKEHQSTRKGSHCRSHQTPRKPRKHTTSITTATITAGTTSTESSMEMSLGTTTTEEEEEEEEKEDSITTMGKKTGTINTAAGLPAAEIIGRGREGREEEEEEIEEREEEWKESWQRWYALFVLCLVSFAAALVWGTLSSAEDAAVGYYGMSTKDIRLSSDWVFYFFPPLTIYASWVITLEHGVRCGLRHVGVLTGVGAAVRLLPCLAELIRLGDVFGPTAKFGHILLQIGQIVAALGFPLLFCIPQALSALWFPAHQRTRATTTALFAPPLLGYTLISTIAPYIAPGPLSPGGGGGNSSSPEEHRAHMLSWLMLIVAAIAAFAMVLSFTVPPWPRYPPSVSAARHRLNTHTGSSIDRSFQAMTSCLYTSVQRWRRALGTITQYPTAVFTVLSAAFAFASVSVWQLSLTQILISSKSAGSLSRANILSLSHLISALVSSTVFAWLNDTLLKKRAVKPLYLFHAVFAALIGLLLAICATPPSSLPEFLISKPFVIAHLAGIGVAAGAIVALTFEAATEALYPIQEGLSAVYAIFCGSILILIVELIAPHIGNDAYGTVLCFLCAGGSVAAMVLRFFAPTRYPRLDLDYGGRMIDYS